jgi:hypothetical protein
MTDILGPDFITLLVSESKDAKSRPGDYHLVAHFERHCPPQ